MTERQERGYNPAILMSLSRVLSTLCVVSCALVPVADAQSPVVYRVRVDDIIHGITAKHVSDAIDEATEANAEFLLLELETPGGLDTAMREIVEKILNSPVPVVVYVSPPGARAASAGYVILLAADVAAMAPGTNTGAATPVSGTGQEIEETMAKKIQSDAAAYVRTLSLQRGRDPDLAQRGVTEAQSWTAEEALEAGLIDLIANSNTDLFEKLDGYTVRRVDKSEKVLAAANPSVQSVEMGWKDEILSVIANPNLAVLLGMLGLAGLYLEFTNPGTLIPGIVGVICLLLAAFAFQILPVNYVGLLLVLVGFGLLAAEAFTPSFGVMGTGGLVGLALGLFFLFEDQTLPTPALRVSFWTILPLVLFFAVMMFWIGHLVISAHRRTPATGEEGMIGRTAEVRQTIAPEGKVFLHGEYWDATASEPIESGQRVRVVSMDGLRLTVEPISTD